MPALQHRILSPRPRWKSQQSLRMPRPRRMPKSQQKLRNRKKRLRKSVTARWPMW
ncbi:UNVERIFIED_CONTAM: hypothetical protein GTU68_025608 [Idotea baltica]|nr:hypothetical protein [Idotea baltica]